VSPCSTRPALSNQCDAEADSLTLLRDSTKWTRFARCSCFWRHLDSTRCPQVTITDRPRRNLGSRVDEEDHSRRGLDGLDARVLGRDGHLHVSLFRTEKTRPIKLTHPDSHSPNISVYWSVYESLKSRYIPGYSAVQSSSSTPRPEPVAAPGTIPITLRYTLCSVTACVIAACVTTPIEVVQARWQTSGGKIQGGVSEIVRQMWKTGGPMAFTRGLGIRIAYAVRCSSLHSSASRCTGPARKLTTDRILCAQIPANGISMTVYESVKRWKGLN
jgi:hypothetical protein